MLGLLWGSVPGLQIAWAELAAAKPGAHKRKRRRRRQRRREDAPGAALYPDLRTLLPSQLDFHQLVDGTHILRFTNIVWNAGEGPLELEGEPGSGGTETLYQNLRDAPIDGKLAQRRQVDGAILYHEGHGHYHFDDFASYVLLHDTGDGIYEPVGEGKKTSFCITDNEPLDAVLPGQYLSLPGETTGADARLGRYLSLFLPEQWVVIGDDPLPDGEYGLQSTVDPKGLLAEGEGGREENNVAIAYFTVADGQIRGRARQPRFFVVDQVIHADLYICSHLR